ncbi:hypothetical protein LUZ61_011879 [Rhynchospora tenuis]|uniref:Retrotransposon Copia-like N-terminal domain-containing protein n=1 Tax=Rhynchospora tenuis TaxID=198213 RepID=A0AAD6F0R9_9POAL|nr:hypothetical protein LUZ61_011879 [Rhynchospora tenuis]
MVSEPLMASDHIPISNSSSPLSSTTVSPSSSSLNMESVVLINLPIATKLSDSNYLAWTAQILPLIHGYDLARFIESPPLNPTRHTTTGQIEINPEFLPWHLKCQIQGARKGDESCAEYLQNLRRVADELAFIRSPVPDDKLVMSAINGLGVDYNPIVAAVKTTSRHSPYSFFRSERNLEQNQRESAHFGHQRWTCAAYTLSGESWTPPVSLRWTCAAYDLSTVHWTSPVRPTGLTVRDTLRAG